MKQKLIFPLILLWALSLSAQSNQEPCAFDQVNQYFDSVNAEQRLADYKWIKHWRSTHGAGHIAPPTGLQQRADCRKAKIIIPLWFHVIHQNGAENISQAQIDNAIEHMNLHYANAMGSTEPAAVNTGYQFVFGGISRVQSSLTLHKRTTETAQLMALSMRSADTFANVWVVKEIQTPTGGSSNIQGYATYPGSIFGAKGQGVVMRYTWLGDFATFGSPLSQYSQGKAFSHELGHYLGLRHPFTDSCTGMYSADCDSKGDLCCDVPPVRNPYQACAQNYNTCNEFYGGDKDDQKANYMDYSNPECKNTFTADQTTLMDALTAKYHPTLGSPLYFPVNLTDCIISARMDGTSAACKGESISIQTYARAGNAYSWQLYKNGTLVHSSSGSHIYTYAPDTGIYTLELTVTAQGKIASQTLDGIQIFDCSKKLKSTKGNWVFAQNAGLLFTPDKVIPDFEPFRNVNPSQINASEGTATISDSSGNLLLYAGQTTGNPLVKNQALRIYGKNYKEIQGSPADSINGSATHGVLFVPMPDSANKYLLFYTPLNTYDVYFHVIDHTDSSFDGIDWHYGKITRKADFMGVPGGLFPSPNFDHNLCAIPRCNPTDYWLLSHDAESGRIAVFSITADSMAYHSSFATGVTNADNTLSFNPQGTHFSFGKSIYTFDRVTGQIALFKTLNPTGLNSIWGAMFSPNGRLLYRSELVNENNLAKFYIYQYNIESSAALLNRSLVTESATDRSMQLGPDGKIYIAVDGDYLSAVHAPNNAIINNANECQYKHVSVPLKVGSTGGSGRANSLPNLINAEIEPLDKTKSSFYVRVSNCTTIAVEPELKCAASFEWIWGDGSANTTSMTASHSYASTGTYTVKLVLAGTDTLVREITLGLAPGAKTISGNTYICDTTLLAEYSVPQHNHRSFVWTATGTHSFAANKQQAVAFWKQSGTVKVIVSDAKGCVDSSTVYVTVPTPIRNNRIDSNQVVCNSSQIQNLTGTIPEGGNGTYTYQWSVRPKDGLYRPIAGATGQNLVPYKNDSSYNYVRTVQSGACVHQSPPIQICNISDLAQIGVSNSGCDRLLRPLDTTFTTAGYSVQWEVSTDSVTFTNIAGATGANLSIPFNIEVPATDYLGFYRQPTKKWYRRKLIAQNCSITSNAIALLPQVYVKGNFKDIPLCPNPNYLVEFEVVNTTLYPLTYTWDVYATESSKLYTTNTTEPKINVNTAALTGSGYAKLKISNLWCPEFAYVTAWARNLGTRTLPLPRGGDTALAIWTDVGGSITLKSNVTKHSHAAFYGWEKSTDQGASWTFYSADEDITLSNVQLSEDFDWYRPYGYNSCFYDKAISYQPTSGTEYGITYGVRVRNPNGHYWIKDSKNDIGDEPNMPDINNYTHSFDVWVRQRSNFGTRVWGYMDQSALKADEDTNFVHVMVRNYGTDSAKGGKLYLYWTVNSTNESWPDKWMGVDYNDVFYNEDDSVFYPRSGRINKTGIDIGNIPPGDSVMRTYEWVHADTIPKPEWYYIYKQGQKKRSNVIGICYLARIETNDDYPHGMTFPERRFTEKTIQHNVVYNRKVASNNFLLDYVRPPFDDQFQGWTFFYVKPKVNMNPRDVKFKMHVNDPVYFNNCEIAMHLSDYMWGKMQTAGFPGVGFTVDPSNQTLVINQNDAIIGNFSCDPNTESGVAFSFRLKASGSGGSAQKPYLFTLSQYVEDSIHLGNMQYGLYGPDDNANEEGEGEGDPMGAPNPQGLDKGVDILAYLEADPNPFTGELHIQYRGGINQKVQLHLYDMNGKLVREICHCQSDDKGLVVYTLNGNEISAGSYILKALENGVEKKMIVIKAE